MKLNLLNRKVHYWAAFVISLPLLVIISSGLMLQMKKHSPWVQPTEQTGTLGRPAVSFESVLAVCRGIPEMRVSSWKDINRIDVRPSKGMMKVWANSGWEAQLDVTTAEVLQVAYRRSDVIEAIHDGSWLHDSVKYFIFFPTGIVLLVLWVTGLYLFFLPFVARRRRRLASAG